MCSNSGDGVRMHHLHARLELGTHLEHILPVQFILECKADLSSWGVEAALAGRTAVVAAESAAIARLAAAGSMPQHVVLTGQPARPGLPG